MTAIRLLIVDDQELFREGLKALFSMQKEIVVVGEAQNGQEAVLLGAQLRPDVILMDLRMPVLNGVEATRRLRVAAPHSRILVLTTFEEDEEVFAALRSGAAGYLLKGASMVTLAEAIRGAARGESFIEPSVAAKVVAEFNRLSSPSSPADPMAEPLSERECEVLRHLAQGKSNKEIAVALRIAEGTVKNHMTNILDKLGVLDRTQAALRARDLGIL